MHSTHAHHRLKKTKQKCFYWYWRIKFLLLLGKVAIGTLLFPKYAVHIQCHLAELLWLHLSIYQLHNSSNKLPVRLSHFGWGCSINSQSTLKIILLYQILQEIPINIYMTNTTFFPSINDLPREFWFMKRVCSTNQAKRKKKNQHKFKTILIQFRGKKVLAHTC